MVRRTTDRGDALAPQIEWAYRNLIYQNVGDDGAIMQCGLCSVGAAMPSEYRIHFSDNYFAQFFAHLL